ncbi:hypothetical protein HNQ36_001215 [Afipia massiliensis]|uniref:Lectin-like protein BA14k n=1 Tax=Afipia massiliensis TaxID=211460 RepID=A0A840N070_9BRAD|nr:BA14K family protein [Afipia massiliensis]MBB5051261.1 hypothetical protein [Afipia massiliensis]
MITFRNGCAVAAVALALPVAATSSSHAAPLAPSQLMSPAHIGADNSLATQVQYRRRYYRGGGGAAGLGIGLAAGALIGGAIAAGSNPYYYGPGYGYGYGGPAYYPAPAPVVVAPRYGYGGGDAEAYCMQRYRSYDPASGTYLNYDGNRYPCP